jgi:triacylglycerol lipase
MTIREAVVRDVQRRSRTKSWPNLGRLQRLIGAMGRAAAVQATEVALLASFAATAPLRLAGFPDRHRFPARPSRASAVESVRPVLLVHGFCGTQSSWSVVARTLSTRGFPVETITYSPFGTSVERLADRVVDAVDRILAQTGTEKVHLIGHSLGGIVIAEAVSGGRLDGLVYTVVTLGSPFGGSPWANLLPVGELARAMRRGSPLLCRLNCAPAPEGVRWLAFTAGHDMIVPGTRSMPIQDSVEAVKIGGVGHLGMLLSREVVDCIADALHTCRTVHAESA